MTESGVSKTLRIGLDGWPAEQTMPLVRVCVYKNSDTSVIRFLVKPYASRMLWTVDVGGGKVNTSTSFCNLHVVEEKDWQYRHTLSFEATLWLFDLSPTALVSVEIQLDV